MQSESHVIPSSVYSCFSLCVYVYNYNYLSIPVFCLVFRVGLLLSAVYSTKAVSEAVRAKRLMKDSMAAESNATSYHQPILDRAAQEMFLTEIFRTMWLVFEQMWKPGFTIMYPMEKGPLSPRFRGEHALRRYPTGMYVLRADVSFIFLLVCLYSTLSLFLQARNDVLLANCVRLFVLLKQSLLRLNQE